MSELFTFIAKLCIITMIVAAATLVAGEAMHLHYTTLTSIWALGGAGFCLIMSAFVQVIANDT